MPFVEKELNELKQCLNLFSEIKWSHVSEQYLEKYIQVIRAFFQYVRNGVLKVRIMFRKREEKEIQSIASTKEVRYFKLYYQFIKHGFGFSTSRVITGNYSAAFLLDELPDHSELASRFKDYLQALPNTKDFADSGLRVSKEDISEVDSRKHVILQCVDIILGAMFFRLNRLNEVKDPVTRRRGKRTIAKEKLYQVIRAEICAIHPGFNIGISTGSRGFLYPHWESPYEHWLFEAKEMV